MEKQNKEKIRFELIGLLQPDSNIRSCLKSVSLPDEWVVTQEYFVRRNEILGVLSYGVSKKGKIHKVNFWNSSANYYVPENAQTEKILNIQIQEEISYLENTLVDFLILISSGEYGWNIGNGIIRILRNKCFYSIFTRDSKLYFSEQTTTRNHLEIEIRTIMDFILKRGNLKIVELDFVTKDFILKELPILPSDLEDKKLEEPVDLKESMLDLLIDSGLELKKANGKEKEILEEVNYGLQNAFESILVRKKEIEFLTEDNWDLILSNHQIFLKSLPEKTNLKWERIGASRESEIQYLSKKYPNHSLQGKLTNYKLKEFLLENVNVRVMNFSRSYFFDSKFIKADFSNSIAVFSKWKNNSVEECNFSNVDFSESEMVDCKFKATNFSKADFESVIFEECIFEFCDFSNTKFKKAIFYKCEFLNCKFNSSRFIEAILYLSDFQNSNIQKAINKNSEFNECNFS
ncbi:MAG: pentapeptide repeat-containing protein [Leptospiraceae bacterium]|nr:pentapeptide repeat-containing protein [Leptospiraceae bacterium]